MSRLKLKFISKVLLVSIIMNLFPTSSIKAYDNIENKKNKIDTVYKNENKYGPYNGKSESNHAYDPFEETKSQLEGYEYKEDTLLIKTKNKFRIFNTSGISNSAIENIEVVELVSKNNSISKKSIEGTWFKAKLKAGSDIESVMNEIKKDNDTLAVEPEYIRKLEAKVPNPGTDSEINEQWYLDTIGVKDAWLHLKEQGINPGGSRDVIVAVIDTGVDYNHSDLAANIWTNPMEIPNDGIDNDGNGYVDDVHGVTTIYGQTHEPPIDYNGHGTHVAGIIAAEAHNNTGGVGIAYNTQIMPIKAAQDGGILSTSDIAKGIIYAAENGADVINMSFGGYGRSIIEEDALAIAFSTSVLVASAGNDGLANEFTSETPTGKPLYPSAYPWVLGVMASSSTQSVKGDWIAGFSNWDVNTENSFEYELMAPGSKIYSTLPDNQYAKWDGTSMSAPVVSGIAALVRSKYDNKDMYSSRFIMGQLASTGNLKQGKTYSDYKEPKMYKEVSAIKALTKTPEPNVTYMEHYLFDKSEVESTTTNDGIVDAGETVDIGMVIRNNWGKAENVNVTIDAKLPSGKSDPYVEIINNNVNFGAIGNFGNDDNGLIYDEEGVITGVQHPFTIKVKENTPNDHLVKLNVKITAKNGFDVNDKTNYEEKAEITFAVRRGTVLPQIIDKDMTISSDKEWLVTNQVMIKKGATVNVEPGSKIEFWSADPSDPYSEQVIPHIRVEGRLLMNGTIDQPIELKANNLHKNYEVKIIATNELRYADVGGMSQSPDIGNEIGGYAELSYVKVENPNLTVSKIDNCYFSQNEDEIIRRYRYNGKIYDDDNYGPIIMAESIDSSKFYKMGVDKYDWTPLAVWTKSLTNSIFDNCLSRFNFGDSNFMGYHQGQGIDEAYGNVFLLNYKDKNGNASIAEIDSQDKNTFENNAILNNWICSDINKWMRIISTGNKDGINNIYNNYWGDIGEKLIDKSIIDINDDFSKPKLEYNPILKDLSKINYPFVTNIYLTNSDGTVVNKVGAETVKVHVQFNRDMNTSIKPRVTFGPDMPTTDYRVTDIEDGGWVSAREWVGEIKITPMTGDGYQFFRVTSAQSNESSWFESGDDRERFGFEIITSGVESMNLQAEGLGNKIKLSWYQDDFETLAGYNIYRSESKNGNYTKINQSIIPGHIKSFEDTQVEPGKTYYYKFTVLQTDMTESDYSNIASASANDTILPVIDHTPITEANVGMPIRITANVSDNVLVKGTTLNYKKVGETEYKSKEMINSESSRYVATIEGSYVSTEGIEYYIEATDGTNIATSTDKTNPHRINVPDKPKVTSISPKEGEDIGGTKVTISGTNFKQGTKVYFNDVEAKEVVVESNTRLTAITPANNAGIVDVKVQNPEGGMDILYNAFTYKKNGVNLTVNTAQGKKGSIIEVPIDVNYIDGFTSGELTFEYDSSVIQFISARNGILNSDFMLASNEIEEGKVKISMAGTEAVNGMGSVLYIKLKVLDEPSTNISQLSLSNVELNGGAITTNITSGQFNLLEGNSVYGNIYYYSNYNYVDNTKITLTGNEGYHETTSKNGEFIIKDVYNGSYKLNAEKSDEINSITSYDASLVLQSLVGSYNLNDYQAIAADANNDGKVNAVDASLILSYSAGKIKLPFQGSKDIWKFESYNKDINIENNDSYGNTLYGILVGDVSGNWNSYDNPEVYDSTADFNTGSIIKNNDGTYTVPVLVSMNNANLFGSDIVISYDNSIAKPVRIEKGNYISEFGIEDNLANDGEIRISLAGANPYDTSGGFINLVFESNNIEALAATTMVKDAEVNENTVNSVIYLSKDVNEDKKIDIFDVSKVALEYNTVKSESSWKDKCDINRDGVIDIFDLVHITKNI